MSKEPVISIILNGPPDSGKDHIADELIKLIGERDVNIPAFHKRFKQKLWELTMSIFNVDGKTFFDLYNNRKTKESPNELFDGLSPRQALIRVSEDIIKPNMGRDYFGKAAAKNLCPGINIFSDGGFEEELYPLIEKSDRVEIVKLSRPGRTFEGDSRGYVYMKTEGNVSSYTMENNFDTVEELSKYLLHFYASRIISMREEVIKKRG